MQLNYLILMSLSFLLAHPMTPPLSIPQLQEKELKKGVALVVSSPTYHQKHVARPSIAFTLIIFNLNIHNKSFSVQLRFQGEKIIQQVIKFSI